MKVIIVGGGKIGAHIAKLLLNGGCQVILIEHRDSILKKLEQDVPKDRIVIGNGSDPSVLEMAHISEADALVAVTGEDEVNLVVSTIAKYEFGVPRVIARVNNPRNNWLFDASCGVDVKFNQADILAHLVIDEINIKNMVMLMELGRSEYSIVQLEVEENSPGSGQLIGNLPIPSGAILIAIQRGEEVILPHGNVKIESGDKMLAMVNELGLNEINALFKNA